MPHTRHAGSTKFGCVGGGSPFTTIGSPYIKVEAEHVWGQAMADIMANGMAPQTAAEKATRRLDAIFADYLSTRRGDGLRLTTIM